MVSTISHSCLHSFAVSNGTTMVLILTFDAFKAGNLCNNKFCAKERHICYDSYFFFDTCKANVIFV